MMRPRKMKLMRKQTPEAMMRTRRKRTRKKILMRSCPMKREFSKRRLRSMLTRFRLCWRSRRMLLRRKAQFSGPILMN